MTKGHKTRFFERFGVPISFTFGSPIIVDSEDDVIRATTDLRKKLQEMVDQEQKNYPVDGAGQWWHPQNRGGTAPTPAAAAEADAERTRRRNGAS